MSRYVIDHSATFREVEERHYITTDGKMWQVIERYGIDTVTKTIKLVWEWINGYLFTKSGRALMTKSGRMICTKSQLEK